MRTCSTRLHHLHCRPSSAPTSQASPPGCHRAFLELFGVHRGGEGSSQYLSRFEHPASSAASVRDPGHRIPNRIGRADENISARAKSHGISRRQFGSKSRHRNRIGTGPSPPEANPTESRKTTRLVTLPSSTIRRSIVVSEFRLHDVNSLTRLMKCRGEVDRGGGVLWSPAVQRGLHGLGFRAEDCDFSSSASLARQSGSTYDCGKADGRAIIELHLSLL